MKVQSSYRLIIIITLILFLSLDCYFIYYFAERLLRLEEPLALNIAGSAALIILSVFEIYSLIKGFKNEDVLIKELVYEGENLNKTALIIANIMLALSIAGTICGFVCPMFFISEAPNIYIIGLISSYLLINCIAFDCYPIVEKLKYKNFLDTLNCKK